jgi:hypothetical protein
MRIAVLHFCENRQKRQNRLNHLLFQNLSGRGALPPVNSATAARQTTWLFAFLQGEIRRHGLPPFWPFISNYP